MAAVPEAAVWISTVQRTRVGLLQARCLGQKVVVVGAAAASPVPPLIYSTRLQELQQHLPWAASKAANSSSMARQLKVQVQTKATIDIDQPIPKFWYELLVHRRLSKRGEDDSLPIVCSSTQNIMILSVGVIPKKLAGKTKR